MSFFGKLFGVGTTCPTTSSAINQLQKTEEILEKKQEYLEKKIENEFMIAKSYGIHSRRGAIKALKRKKQYEKQLEHIDRTISTIEMQRSALENATTTSEVLEALQIAAKAQKIANMNMDIGQVHNIMDKISEQQTVAKELSDAISNSIALGDDINDSELETELDELVRETSDKESLDVGSIGNFSSISSGKKLVFDARKQNAKLTEDNETMRLLLN